MGTVVDKLNKILSIKETIKQAIISKGVSISDTDTFASYADKIEAIITGSGSVTKYGLSMDSILGNVDENGVLQQPIDGNLVFTGVVSIPSNLLQYKFYKNSNIKSVEFPDLTSIGSSGLYHCFQDTKIITISFPALKSTSFGSYTNQFTDMLSGVTGCTVHFPSNLESVIDSWSDVTSGFSGTNTTVLFDLPATE